MGIEKSPDENTRYAFMRSNELITQATTLRESNILSQRQLADLLGLKSHSNITLIEQHKTIPSLDRFLRILSAFGYTLEIVEKPGIDP